MVHPPSVLLFCGRGFWDDGGIVLYGATKPRIESVGRGGGSEATRAVVNDSSVDCQSRKWTEPQRDIAPAGVCYFFRREITPRPTSLQKRGIGFAGDGVFDVPQIFRAGGRRGPPLQVHKIAEQSIAPPMGEVSPQVTERAKGKKEALSVFSPAANIHLSQRERLLCHRPNPFRRRPLTPNS